VASPLNATTTLCQHQRGSERTTLASHLSLPNIPILKQVAFKIGIFSIETGKEVCTFYPCFAYVLFSAYLGLRSTIGGQHI